MSNDLTGKPALPSGTVTRFELRQQRRERRRAGRQGRLPEEQAPDLAATPAVDTWTEARPDTAESPPPGSDKVTGLVPPQVLTDQAAPIEKVLKPPRKRRRGIFGTVWFGLAFILPVLVAIGYLWGYATPRYVSEFKFSVKTQDGGGQETAPISSVTAPTGPPGFFDTYIVVDYINSPQAVRDVLRTIDLRAMFARADADRFARLTPDASFEELYAYWSYRVRGDFDMLTGIGTVSAQGFSAEDARLLARRLLELSENLINDTRQRVRADNLRFAEGQVKEAEKRVQSARKAIQEFRNTQRIVDPTVDVNQNQTLVGQLTAQLTELNSQLSTLERVLSREAPQITLLRSRIRAVEEQLQRAKVEMGSATGVTVPGRTPSGDGSQFEFYAQQLVTYQGLQTEQDLSNQNYQSAMRSLEQARQLASAQHAYVLAYVQPTAADTPLYPMRLRTLIIVAIAALMFWVLTTLVSHAVRDHVA
jgi:capsular polysaccharide transport system permease protein